MYSQHNQRLANVETMHCATRVYIKNEHCRGICTLISNVKLHLKRRINISWESLPVSFAIKS